MEKMEKKDVANKGKNNCYADIVLLDKIIYFILLISEFY